MKTAACILASFALGLALRTGFDSRPAPEEPNERPADTFVLRTPEVYDHDGVRVYWSRDGVVAASSADIIIAVEPSAHARFKRGGK